MMFPVEIDGDEYFRMISSIKDKCNSWDLPNDMNPSLAQIDKALLAFDELYCDDEEAK
jgi:hypothetical protein